MTETVDVTISEGLIAPIIQAKVAAAVVAAIGDKEAFASAAVKSLLEKKVDYEGKVSQYGNDNRNNLVDILCKQAMSKAVQDGIRAYIADNQAQITAAVTTAIKSRPTVLAKAMIAGLTQSLRLGENIKMSVDFNIR